MRSGPGSPLAHGLTGARAATSEIEAAGCEAEGAAGRELEQRWGKKMKITISGG